MLAHQNGAERWKPDNTREKLVILSCPGMADLPNIKAHPKHSQTNSNICSFKNFEDYNLFIPLKHGYLKSLNNFFGIKCLLINYT